ncbi:MAG: LamG-like jellyroll fold domain-containing protein [bacterium]
MNKRAFTLIELLIVIAIIAVLAGVIFVALNPLQRFRDARNSRRVTDVLAIADAVRIYQFGHGGQLPTGLDGIFRMLGTATTGCDIACGAASSYVDDTQVEFDAGSYSLTVYDAINSWVGLTSAGRVAGSGYYSSEIKDAGSSASWIGLGWTPQFPYYKELPNSSASESNYPDGNANMNGNVLLMHMNETSGVIQDTSGNNNNATNNGASYGATGQFNSGLNFDGSNDYIRVSDSNSLDVTSAVTFAGWFRADGFSHAGGGNYPRILHKNAAYAVFIENVGNKLVCRMSGLSVGDLVGVTSLNNGQFYHFACTYDSSTGIKRIYINGLPDKSSTAVSGNIAQNSNDLYIGDDGTASRKFDGILDEITVFNRALSSDEVLDHYRRGALRLTYQVRSCDDILCSGETFIGPDGTNSTYYSELSNSTTGLPTLTLTNVPDNQYFQYQTTFQTSNSSYSPELYSVSIANSSSSGATLQPACLDLSAILSEQLSTIPYDPSSGNHERTYYATRRRTGGQIDVLSCGAEGDENISVSK